MGTVRPLRRRTPTAHFVRVLRVALVMGTVALVGGTAAPDAVAPGASSGLPSEPPRASPGYPAVGDASIRDALAAARPGETTVIHLGTTWLWRRDDAPLVVTGHVRIVGQGPLSTVIDAVYRGQVFDVRPGAELELESLALIRGARVGTSPAAGDNGTRIELADVLVSGGVPDSGQSLAEYCLSQNPSETQYYREGVLTDWQAIANAPGAAF